MNKLLQLWCQRYPWSTQTFLLVWIDNVSMQSFEWFSVGSKLATISRAAMKLVNKASGCIQTLISEWQKLIFLWNCAKLIFIFLISKYQSSLSIFCMTKTHKTRTHILHFFASLHTKFEKKSFISHDKK